MSYSCYISFKEISPENLYTFFLELKANTLKKMSEIADHSYLFSPFFNDMLSDYPEKYSKIPYSKRKEAKSWAVNSIFTYSFFYDQQHQLLGVIGVDDTLNNMFDTVVYFQNSSDQNYERECWEGIRLFEEIYDKWMTYPDEYIISEYSTVYNEEYTSENRDESLMYYRKEFCYKEIWNMFEYEVHSQDKLLSLAALHINDKHTETFVKLCYEKVKSWN